MGTAGRVRRWGVRLVAVVVSVTAFGGVVGPADSYNKIGCFFPSSTVHFALNSSYETASEEATGAWHNATSIQFRVDGTQLKINNENNGSDGHDGVTHYSCPGFGVWTSTVVSAYNTYYTSGYGTTARKQVMVHELGHALGLAHAGSSDCNGQPIMYFSSDRWFICNHQNPQKDDINGVNSIYN